LQHPFVEKIDMPDTIGFTADIHLSHTIWEAQRQISGDSQVALNEIAKASSAAGLSDLILAGDIFDVADPHPGLVEMFRRFAEDVTASGIRLWYIQGNHDRRVVPWAKAASGLVEWIGDGTPRVIGGRTVVGFDYAPRESIATSLAALGTAGPVDLLILHQFARQYMDIDGCWNLDLEWVPDNVGDVVMGDIHEPWSGIVGKHRCWYTHAPQTRSITEAKHPKSLLVLDAEGEWSRKPLASRPIRAWSMTDENKDTTVSEIRGWLAHVSGPAADLGLPPVVYLLFDTTVTAAPDLVHEVIRHLGITAFVVSREIQGGPAGTIRTDTAAAVSEIPGPEAFVARLIPDTNSLAYSLALDFLDAHAGKTAITAKIEHARNRFFQSVTA
jgi:hypothetical protein